MFIGIGISPVIDGGTPIGLIVSDADAAAYIAAMTTKPDQTRATLIDNYVAALKAATIWDKIDVLYLLAAHDAAAGRLNVKAPATFTATTVNSPTFATDRGYTGNGTNQRVRTNFVPSTQAVQFTQNNGGAWVWTRTAADQSAASSIGNVSASRVNLVVRNASDLASVIINNATAGTVASTDGSGLFGVTRAASGTAKVWRNGAQLGADLSNASAGLPAQEQWILGANSSGFSTNQVAMAAWTTALAGLEAAFYSATLTYMQGVGAAA